MADLIARAGTARPRSRRPTLSRSSRFTRSAPEPSTLSRSPVVLNCASQTHDRSREAVGERESAGAFIAVVLGGYVGKWGWTGFRGNTLWNWLQLLLLPLLLPTVVVPALMPIATSNAGSGRGLLSKLRTPSSALGCLCSARSLAPAWPGDSPWHP